MTARFRPAPPWLRRLLATGTMLVYGGLFLMSLVGMTWPRTGMTALEFYAARGAGITLALAAAGCLLSVVVPGPPGEEKAGHRWRWELRGSWIAGTAVAVYALVVLSVDPLADRGLLALSLSVLSLLVFLRGLSLLSFESETRAAKAAAEGG